MLNLLKKTTPWMVASLFVATSVFGQDNGACPKPCPPKCEPKCPPKPCPPKPCPPPCPQPCPPTQVCPGQDPCCPPWATPVLNAAYNYPARTQTRCPWDIFFDASFIYWQPLQENMELGISTTAAVPATAGITDGRVLNMDFNYKPGFKVGLGGYFDHDNWDLHAEYTWFHGRQSQSATAPAGGAILATWGHPGFGGGDTFDTVSERWRLNMDIGELDLGRWYYVGTKLVFRPNFGARATWIRQNLNVQYEHDDTIAVEGDTIAHINLIKAKTRSWAVGAKTGLETNWCIGSGFRLHGCGEADLLFTKYTKLSMTQTHTPTTTHDGHTLNPSNIKQSRVYAVKPHLELALGIGWGTYLDCNNWYMDFAAEYGFQVFFEQNMFRHYNDDIMLANSILPNGNLYIHGLTATFKLDF